MPRSTSRVCAGHVYPDVSAPCCCHFCYKYCLCCTCRLRPRLQTTVLVWQEGVDPANVQLRCFGGLFGTDLSLDLVWVPRGNPADAPSRFASASWRLFPILWRKCCRLPPSVSSNCFSGHCQNLLRVRCVDAQAPLFIDLHQADRRNAGVGCSC